MKGIVLTGHGKMMIGMIDTIHLVFGRVDQLEAVCLLENDSPETFSEKLQQAIKRVDTGDGVVICCDLLFGTPCNCAANMLSRNVDVIAGVNLGFVLEMLGNRQSEDFDLDKTVETGKNGILNLKKLN